MGVIVETYPHLFTMYVESQRSTVSFSYAELLTREVEVEILPGNRKLIQF
ncbi:MAG TPA: Veg family protein [Synergistales bacterium]|nr:Veg family protein [Synergistales bacterium]